MNEQLQDTNAELVNKIARLVQERGWNQERFALNAGLNRQTARQILLPGGDRRLRNNTIKLIADSLGLTVHELRTLPLELLLPRMHKQDSSRPDGVLRYLYEQVTQPALQEWIEKNPVRARTLNSAAIDELLSLQGTG